MKLLQSFASLLLIAAGAAARADVPSTHGMLLFGKTSLYASHLPMFHRPHDYQLVMRISLGNPEAQKLYLNELDKGQKLFTLVPEVMDLTTVMSGQKSAFAAQLYVGHFERGGTPLARTMVKVETLIVSTSLNPVPVESESYVAFGENGEFYAVHTVNGKGSFDAVVAIAAPYFLEQAVCRTRVCAEPVETPLGLIDGKIILPVETLGEKLALPQSGAEIGTAFLGGAAKILDVIYSEVGELAH